MDPVLLPAGTGLRAVSAVELRERDSVFDLLTIWERPRRTGRRRYFVGVDVSDGIGQDRSVVEVIREATIEEPAEQVAEFVTDTTPPAALAPIVHTIGTLYADEDGLEAQVIIECNNHGLSVQNMLQEHLGYQHFYIWQYLDSRDAERRFSTRIGWYTTPATRPLLLDRFYTALTTLDPISGQPDLITHSPLLHAELKDFQTETTLAEAAASRGAHDDAILALAIGYYASWKRHAGETEPLDDRRRRKVEQTALLAQVAARQGVGRPDWRNTATTADEAKGWYGLDAPDDLDDSVYDAGDVPLGRPY